MKFFSLTTREQEYIRLKPDLAGWLCKITLSGCGLTLACPGKPLIYLSDQGPVHTGINPILFRNPVKLLEQLNVLRSQDKRWVVALWQSDTIETQTLIDLGNRYARLRPVLELCLGEQL